MSDQKTVVIGMSGGVDSSLAAALLREQGYAVIGVYMKNWSEPIKGVEHCPWVQDQLDARMVADQLGIPFYTVDFEDVYKKFVVDSFFADYAAGRTPNPDILCNKFIKFDAFWKYAQSLGADFVATGHYARMINGQLYKGVDAKKDQSYFLWAVSREVLPHIIFPLGNMTKVEVREAALARGLTTAKKKDSQGICFIGQADVRDFIATRLAPKPGEIINLKGEVIGTHRGAWFYTIGQKVGSSDIRWGDDAHRPVIYVVATDVTSNQVVVGEEADLYASKLVANDVQWLTAEPEINQLISAKIRYGQTNVPCVMLAKDGDEITIAFDAPQRAITPGQSIVMYDGEKVLGGGIISKSL